MFIGPITASDESIVPRIDLGNYLDQKIRVKIGGKVNIKLPFSGKPKPTVSWTKDRIPIKRKKFYDAITFYTI